MYKVAQRIMCGDTVLEPGTAVDTAELAKTLGEDGVRQLLDGGDIVSAIEVDAAAKKAVAPQDGSSVNLLDALAGMTLPQAAETARGIATDAQLRAQLDMLLGAVDKLEPRASLAPADRQTRLRDALVEIIATADPASATKSGKVTTEALMRASGLPDVSGSERDAIMTWWQSKNPGKRAFGEG